ncbi:SDR family oxidoreductase [Pseudonocardia sp. CA-107938]|uniref:SDR family oxidoreductase n=1 Tax=Pseudonocardia sp. CA-107938 TaxID=3240021 RepID=UPI003D8A2FBD
MTKKIVVTGATGNVGSHLVQALLDAGEEVTAVARRIVGTPPRAHTVAADLADPPSLKPALDGADAVFLLTAAGFLAGGDLVPVLDVVRAAGVRQVVLLSSQGVGTGRHPAHLEAAVLDSGLEATVLRGSGFATNALAWAASVRADRTVAAPFGDVALPLVDPHDIAASAAAVLRGSGHGGRTYVLTGPRAITPREQAAAIGAAIGEPVRFVEQTREQARAAMLAMLPAPVVESTLDILGAPTAEEQQVSPHVGELTGRAPRDFTEWAARSAAAFR